ncbi:embryogenesis-associated protein emb8-like [Stylonychia lemnae]|uniref:Embryogenesis-associated protein emb8-like n=1 Tax=Stylonychia lemnae TaxID=5949 RepID=A0A078A9I1_STYLE|nr:embryogenesis-associated protein emb8-like [Stylonychia lemnae]|eukprot:CDW77448.1 embryogenesis-associated protein emb8-like [Stylonychia lemnae]
MLGSLQNLYDDTNLNDSSYILCILALIVSLKIISNYQTEKMRFHYNKQSTLMREFVKTSKIREYTYTPYWCTLNAFTNCMIFLFCELASKLMKPVKYERELFTLSDGGTIALDWIVDHEGGLPKKHSQRPVICMMSGLSGGNDNLYLISLVKEAMRLGYKCVIINYRGTSGVKLTSSKIYWMNQWEDVKEPIDYISQKYCRGEEYLKRSLYGYGASLGGQFLSSYLIHEGQNSVLDGAITYGQPFNLKDNVEFFKKNCFKFFDFGMGFIYSLVLQHDIMPDLKNYISQEQYNQMQENIKKHRCSLMDLDQNVLIPYVGYKDLNEYYNYTQAQGKIHKIRTPIMFLNSEDDPCIQKELYPFKECEGNEFTLLAMTKRGGHCSHITGGVRPFQWFSAPCMEFFEFLENKKRATTKVE